ncbi:unnamed protein product [Medioppia subpectinata]|uniref:Uncharacterized protein n=1 Tax=Medioppia subpectinata TaxID=1979941 RepID=A0A7R9LWI8_9ACAR|nr:unnamed protein product [Medioppia subpectinata]CAG2122307.1 unnamed protein product [Medioppia subpectinata]
MGFQGRFDRRITEITTR